MGKGPKWYSVRVGRKSGVFQTWDEAKALVNGFTGAVFKSFPTREQAESFLNAETETFSLSSASTPPEPMNEDTSIPRSKRQRLEKNVSLHSVDFSAASDEPKLLLYGASDGGARGNPGIAGCGGWLSESATGVPICMEFWTYLSSSESLHSTFLDSLTLIPNSK